MSIVTVAAEALTSSASTRHEQGKGNAALGRRGAPGAPLLLLLWDEPALAYLARLGKLN